MRRVYSYDQHDTVYSTIKGSSSTINPKPRGNHPSACSDTHTCIIYLCKMNIFRLELSLAAKILVLTVSGWVNGDT